MSYCEIIAFTDNKPDKSQEFSNAWGGAAYIWDNMYAQYLKDPSKEHDIWMFNTNKLWALASQQDIPSNLRTVLMSTFDYAIVNQENFPEYIQHLQEFIEFFGTGNQVCHLKGWSEFVQRHMLDAQAIGFYATSVGENLWYTWDEEREESVPYDLSVGDKHFEIYEEINSQKDAK